MFHIMKYLEPKTAHKHIMKYKTTVKTLVTYKEIYMLGAFLFFFFNEKYSPGIQTCQEQGGLWSFVNTEKLKSGV